MDFRGHHGLDLLINTVREARGTEHGPRCFVRPLHTRRSHARSGGRSAEAPRSAVGSPRSFPWSELKTGA